MSVVKLEEAVKQYVQAFVSHPVEDGCLGCPKIELGRSRGRLFWCVSTRSYVRTNPLCPLFDKKTVYAPFAAPPLEG